MMTRVFYLVSLIVITLLLVTLTAIGQQVKVDGVTVVEYSVFENAIKVSSKVDFATVRIMFDDLPGQSLSVKELRDVIKARPKPP